MEGRNASLADHEYAPFIMAPSFQFNYQPNCPVNSPWLAEDSGLAAIEMASSKINLEEFMPLKDLMETNLHSLESCGSEQSTCQVSDHFFVGMDEALPPSRNVAPSMPIMPKNDSIETADARRKTCRRKLLLPASTRKTNREAQQRFRLKQKQRQQEMSDEVDRLRVENGILIGKVKRLESLLNMQFKACETCKLKPV